MEKEERRWKTNCRGIRKIASTGRTPSPRKSCKQSDKEKEAPSSEESIKSARESHRTGSSKSHKSAKPSRHKEDGVEVLHAVNEWFRLVMDFHGYRLADRSTHYKEQATNHPANWASRPQVQMKSELFEIMDQISIIGFIHAFKTAGDNNRVQEGAPMWLVILFIKKTPAEALAGRLSLKHRSSHGSVPEVMLTSYVQVKSHLSDTDATYDIIAVTDIEIVRFTQPKNMLRLQ